VEGDGRGGTGHNVLDSDGEALWAGYVKKSTGRSFTETGPRKKGQEKTKKSLDAKAHTSETGVGQRLKGASPTAIYYKEGCCALRETGENKLGGENPDEALY